MPPTEWRRKQNTFGICTSFRFVSSFSLSVVSSLSLFSSLAIARALTDRPALMVIGSTLHFYFLFICLPFKWAADDTNVKKELNEVHMEQTVAYLFSSSSSPPPPFRSIQSLGTGFCFFRRAFILHQFSVYFLFTSLASTMFCRLACGLWLNYKWLAVGGVCSGHGQRPFRFDPRKAITNDVSAFRSRTIQSDNDAIRCDDANNNNNITTTTEMQNKRNLWCNEESKKKPRGFCINHPSSSCRFFRRV